MPLKGGREERVVRGWFWVRFLRANKPGAWAPLAKFDPVATKLVPSPRSGNAIPLLLFEGYLTRAA